MMPEIRKALNIIMENDDIAVTEMVVIEEAHMRIDTLLIYMEKND